MIETNSLVVRIASRYGVDSRKFYDSLKATAFRQSDGTAPTDEQMLCLLVVADQYNLNPFTREIYAYPDKKSGGVIPVVGVDGWSRIINDHPAYDGIEFVYASEMTTMAGAKVACHEWIEGRIFRKDRSRPIVVREYLDETYRPPYSAKNGRGERYAVDGPWQTHTKRQLRHKTFIQAGRVAFGFGGIYDPDEAERIQELQESGVSSAVMFDNAKPLQIDRKSIDPVLAKLSARAQAANAWTAAHQYVSDRFAGAERDYAIQYLRDIELSLMDRPPIEYDTEYVSLENRSGDEPMEVGDGSVSRDPSTALESSSAPVHFDPITVA